MGSGGRDLSGNKRTNKDQAFDQKFEKLNEALRVSCKKGYPVRVVRSHKEKRSSYAPESGVRYDGIYRIEQCWRKVGVQGYKVCRYLFVRCDNEPAPWTSDEHGDRPRPVPAIKELKKAIDITTRKEGPSWDYLEEHGWKWTKPQPASRKPVITGNPEEGKRTRKAMRHAHNLSVREKLLKEFSCLICRKVMTYPLTTPCAHNFCKSCLLGSFADPLFVRERTREGGRTLRAQKIVKKCPCCPNDISDFLQNPQVNREMMDLIETLQQKTEEGTREGSDVMDKLSEVASDGVEVNKLNDKESVDDVEESLDLDSGYVEDSEVEKGSEIDEQSTHAAKRAKKSDEDHTPMDVGGSSNSKAKQKKSTSCYMRKGVVKKTGMNSTTKKVKSVEAGDDSPSSPLSVHPDEDDDFQ